MTGPRISGRFTFKSMAPEHAEAIVAMKPPAMSSIKKVISDEVAKEPKILFHPKSTKKGRARTMLHMPPKRAMYLLFWPYKLSPIKPPVRTPAKAAPARIVIEPNALRVESPRS
mmetsp:Transcript_27083/g.50904  ORF Transcript_27083/g.50904 Transcript_27083/m.50904 type:complete len:114 (+) Transcript_27083:582-923(+)